MLSHIVFAAVLASSSSNPTVLPAEQLQADFQQLYQQLQQGSYNLFALTPKAEYDQHYADFQQRLQQPLTPLEARKVFMQFTAFADIVHTRIDFPVAAYRSFLENGGKTLPFDVAIAEHGVTVTDTFGSDNPLQLGDEVVQVNGVPVRTWLAQLQSFMGAENQQLLDGMTATSLAPLAWLYEGEQDSYTLTVKSVDNAELRIVTLATLDYDAQAGASATATQAAQASTPPVAPRDYRIVQGDVGYLKPGPFYNIYAENVDQTWDITEFHGFIDEAFNAFIAADVAQVVIDVRDNPGGTNSFSDHMIAWFADQPFKFASDFRVKVSAVSRAANDRRLAAEGNIGEATQQLAEFYATHADGEVISFPLTTINPHPDGQNIAHRDIDVYVLIDRYSYSNAVSVAAIAQDYGFATIIGEATADLATTYAAMEQFTLDHSGINVGYAKAHIIRPSGDLRPAGVVPDIALPFMGELDNEQELQRVVAAIKALPPQ
ncbi:S41 family peptidase [Pseudidiomarina salilacus]|uniref:S41 family peptidase n=1 Tax=Pseudidiomarina salilacus TaxID=3384452 RepID=UPI003985300E